MLEKPLVSEFSHVKPGETPWRSDGLRDFFLYRDLGVAAATGGRVIAQLVKANEAPEKGTGWHRHEADFHIVFMTKGWAKFMYENKEHLVRPAIACISGPAFNTICSITRRTWNTWKWSARRISGQSILKRAPRLCRRRHPGNSAEAGRARRIGSLPASGFQNSMSSSSICSGSLCAAAHHSRMSGHARTCSQ